MNDLKDLDSNIIPFPTVLSLLNNIFCFTVALIGVVACIWLLIANLFGHKSSSTRLLLSISVADSLVLGAGFVTTLLNQIAKGYSLGLKGCLLNYFLVLAPAGVSIVTLGVVAWERYQAVCNGYQWSDLKINLSIALIWMLGTGLAAIPIITQNYSSVQLEPNSVSCNVKWFDRSPQSLFITAIILLLFAVVFSVALYSYYNVYMTFRNVTKQQKVNQENQRIVFHKCLAMSASLVLLWTPYFTKVFYEIMFGESAGADWTSIGNMGGILCSTLNPFILCRYDNRVRKNMVKFMNYFKKPVPTQGDASNNFIPEIDPTGSKPATSRMAIFSSKMVSNHNY